jgi:hypothetical protein
MKMNADIIFYILNCLESYDVLKCGLINKQLNKISKNELIWKRLCEEDWLLNVTHKFSKIIIKNYRIEYEQYHKRINALTFLL